MSTAADAYQITRPTWQTAVAALEREGVQITDFSVVAQDTVAEWLIRRSNALELVKAGKIEEAIPLLNRLWVSLPGGSQQASGLDMRAARQRYDRYVAERALR